MHQIVCHYVHNKCLRPIKQHALTLVTPIMSMSPSNAAITCYNFTHSIYCCPMHQTVCHYVHNKSWWLTSHHALTSLTPIHHVNVSFSHCCDEIPQPRTLSQAPHLSPPLPLHSHLMSLCMMPSECKCLRPLSTPRRMYLALPRTRPALSLSSLKSKK